MTFERCPRSKKNSSNVFGSLFSIDVALHTQLSIQRGLALSDTYGWLSKHKQNPFVKHLLKTHWVHPKEKKGKTDGRLRKWKTGCVPYMATLKPWKKALENPFQKNYQPETDLTPSRRCRKSSNLWFISKKFLNCLNLSIGSKHWMFSMMIHSLHINFSPWLNKMKQLLKQFINVHKY